MTLNELEKYFNSILKLENFENDISLNGLQVQNADKDAPIKKLAYAVDACYATVEKAIEEKADVLLVHHGFFWGHPLALTGSHYRVIKKMMENNLALYAAHIPLDANEEVGNNFGLAFRLGLENLEKFGSWRGMVLGVKGKFSKAMTIEEVQKKLFLENQKPLGVLPFGKKEISSVGIISGGACEDVEEAIAEGLDLYITGEISHQIYHQCLENKINFIAGGHYNTETVGVTLLAEKLKKETGLETVFIDVPTGL
ncbi:MAG: Nif3-like dinuclear metal center hexameric protein [Treponemataceae bacterium]|nr:Nif3-like dinuclear metal center hexameric protein [Treponemataceae bacterium]